MSVDNNRPSSEREQTDESLRVEREKVDDALGEKLASIDDIADTVLSKARARADEVLAAARAKTDRRQGFRASSTTGATIAPSTSGVAEARVIEDRAVAAERADADETLRVERAAEIAILAIEREETDQDLNRERARSDDNLATRDEFMGIVSHDLRNMLSGVMGYAQLIASEASTSGPDRLVTYAQRIQRSGGRMNRLIGDLVDVVSIEAGMLAVTREISDPSHVVTEAIDTLAAQATANGLSLEAEIVQPLPSVAFDPARILQVLINLLTNALKFTPAGGRVVVHLEAYGDDMQFAVHDTGRGIPRDMLEEVFKRFLQVDAKDRRGVGLGLYISRCIVQGHGGKIWAESTLGAGSTFAFTLPIAPRVATERTS